MNEPPRISVVIPTYQRCASLRRTLEALTRQTLDPSEYEVIVAIDGSDDGTREMVDRFHAHYRLRAVWQPNQGRAAARNAGVQLAEGRLIVFLDDDMEAVPDFLAAHSDAHPAGSRKAVVGPVPIPDDPASPPIVDYRRQAMNQLHERLAQPGYDLRFRDVYTGNLSVARDVLRDVGAFDASFKAYGHEDYEIALRFVKAGVQLGYSLQAVAYQEYDKDFPALAQDCIARGQTAVLFASKHPDVAPTMRLAGYRDGPLKWRLVRSAMLWASTWLPSFPDWVIRFMAWLERRRPRRLYKYYTLAIDYFFWLGARSALRERSPADPWIQSTNLPLRARVGLALLVGFALASGLRLLGRALGERAHVGQIDEITSYEGRFAELRQALPPRAQVGYVTNYHPGPADGIDAERLAFKQYLLTQYALLPALVSPDATGSLIVGNFDGSTIGDSVPSRGLTLVRDFGNGVALFRAKAQ